MNDDKVFRLEVYPRITYENLEGKLVTEFEENDVLALLLANGTVFLNNHWWRKDFTEEQKQLFSINLNVNDIFGPCADAEEVLYNEFEDLYEHYEKDPDYGVVIWCAKKRKMLPRPRICNCIVEQGIWNLENLF